MSKSLNLVWPQHAYLLAFFAARTPAEPFVVAATQNPIEQEGTYPLPEAQLDRFMLSLYLDYPQKSEKMEVVRRTTYRTVPTLSAAVSREENLDVQKLVRAVPVSDHVMSYAVDIAAATRSSLDGAPQAARDYIECGAGPRASQYLVLGAKALAMLDGRTAPQASDVREIAASVLLIFLKPVTKCSAPGRTGGGCAAWSSSSTIL